MSMRPAQVREQLFPQYYGAVVQEDGLGDELALDTEDMYSDADDQRDSSVNSEERQNIERCCMLRVWNFGYSKQLVIRIVLYMVYKSDYY